MPASMRIVTFAAVDDVDAVGAHHHVGAVAAVHDVVAGPGLEGIGNRRSTPPVIRSSPSPPSIELLPAAAGQGVVADLAVEEVVIGAAADPVVAAAAIEEVVAGVAGQAVIALAAIEGVGAGRALQRFWLVSSPYLIAIVAAPVKRPGLTGDRSR